MNLFRTILSFFLKAISKCKIVVVFFLFLSVFGFGQEKPVPEDFKVIAEKMGDLDNDGIDEKVIVYETNESTDFGNLREICILKHTNKKWVAWHESKNAILKSEDGGILGDPFEGVKIHNGVLSISFSGGGGGRWSYTDIYRFQNNQFELIGYTSSFLAPCEYSDSVDYNLSTGKLIVKKEYEKCENDIQEIYKTENETFYKKDIHITLQDRQKKEVKITTPIYKLNIYIATGEE